MEDALKRLIEKRRAQDGVHTFWDDELAVIAQPALASYELDRVIGITFGNEEFQTGVKRVVPSGYSFKGYPTCFNTTNPEAILATLLKAPAASDIVDCKVKRLATFFSYSCMSVTFYCFEGYWHTTCSPDKDLPIPRRRPRGLVNVSSIF